MNAPLSASARILAIDDDVALHEALRAALRPEPFELVCVSSVSEAKNLLETLRPHVILCDVRMPDGDGISFCRTLKESDRHSKIPVIMMTASGTEEMTRCFDAGADDFLAKPPTVVELRARVRSMVRIKRQIDSLDEGTRMREDLAYMLVHDIKNPLTSLLVNSEFLVTSHLDDVQRSCAREIAKAGRRINSMVNDLLMLAKMQAGRLSIHAVNVDLRALSEQTLASYQAAARARQIVLTSVLPQTPVKATVDPNLIQRVLDNLLSNAIKFSHQHGTVTLRLTEPDRMGRVHLGIEDDGPGITPEHRSKIFDKF